MHGLNCSYFNNVIKKAARVRWTLAFANDTEWMHRGNNVTCSITKKINP